MSYQPTDAFYTKEMQNLQFWPKRIRQTLVLV